MQKSVEMQKRLAQPSEVRPKLLKILLNFPYSRRLIRDVAGGDERCKMAALR
jgi:hypothetical protein